MDFTVVSKAGLTQGEFASLCGVSRGSVNLGVNGKMRPCRSVAKHVTDTLDAVKHAVENQRLPLAAKTPRKTRIDLILLALTK